MTAGWLFEIGVEELPYRTCQSVLAQLRGDGTAEAPGLVYETLAAERLVGGGDGGAADAVAFAETRLKVMVAPRRIAVLVGDVPREQTAQTLRWRGPRADVAFGPDGAPTKAGEGFARGKGLKPAQLARETVDGTEFVVAVIEAERRPAERVLPDVCRRLITSLQIPRGMRWGARPAGADEYLRFSRPLRWLVCIFAGQPVPFDFYDLRAGAVTQGHRVLGRPVIVDHASHYERHLREQHVIADHDERRRLIVEGLDAAAAKLGGRWSDPAGVLEENIYLAEWPSVHSGSFDPAPPAPARRGPDHRHAGPPALLAGRRRGRRPAAGLPLRVERRPGRGGAHHPRQRACARRSPRRRRVLVRPRPRRGPRGHGLEAGRGRLSREAGLARRQVGASRGSRAGPRRRGRRGGRRRGGRRPRRPPTRA